MTKRGKVLKVDVTPYHILDVMTDPAYMPHFVRRYHIALEEIKSKGRKAGKWVLIYGDNPKLLYDDAIDNIKQILGIQKTSASQIPFSGTVQNIVLNACSDWITEKTGRTPEFETFRNTVKSARTNFEYYGHYLKDKEKRG